MKIVKYFILVILFSCIGRRVCDNIDRHVASHTAAHDLEKYLINHERPKSFEYSFSFQPTKCNISDPMIDSCPNGNGDTKIPAMSEPYYDYYTRLGASVASQIFTSGSILGVATNLTTGLGDILWRYPTVNYVGTKSDRGITYDEPYVHHGALVPPAVIDEDHKIETITSPGATIRVLMDRPLVRWTLDTTSIRIPWKYIFRITSAKPTTLPISVPSPSPSPSPLPSPSPSPLPSPSPSPSPSPLPSPSPSPVPSSATPSPLFTFPESNPQQPSPASFPHPILPDLPLPGPYILQMEMGPLASIGGSPCDKMGGGSDDMNDVEGGRVEGTFCSDEIACLRNVVKKLPRGAGKCARLACNLVTDDDDGSPIKLPLTKLAIEIAMETAQCKMNYIRPEAFLIQKMLVLGDFGETVMREIVVPNIFTTAPITYSAFSSVDDDDITPPTPSPTPSPTPYFPIFSPTPAPMPTPVSPFRVPLGEIREPRIFTESTKRGFSDENKTVPLWRVIVSQSVPQPPTEVLDAIYPSVGGGAIISCASDLPIGEICATDAFGKYLPVHVNRHGFWFFVPEEAYNIHFGTHAGMENSGSPTQLGIDPLNLLSEMEKYLTMHSRIDNGTLVDICNDIEFVMNETDALNSIAEGIYPYNTRFMYLDDLLTNLMNTFLPALSGACSAVEKLLHGYGGLFPDSQHLHLDNITFLQNQTWLPKGYNPNVPQSSIAGVIAEHLHSNLSKVLFSGEKANWFVDGPYLYHRVMEEDLASLDPDDIPPGVDIQSTIHAVDNNNLVKFIIDISTTLMEYAGATSPVYFPTNGDCFLDGTQLNATVGIYHGFMNTTVCVPDTENEVNDTFSFTIDYVCDKNLILAGNVSNITQDVPDIAVGTCEEMTMPYSVYSKAIDDVDGLYKTLEGKVYNATCTLTLKDTTDDGIVYDLTWVKCEADATALCKKFGGCEIKKNDEFMILIIICAVMLTIMIVGGISWFLLYRQQQKQKIT